jgi:lysosomal-associated membrane protein 1/2
MDFMYTSKDNKNLTLVYDLPETADGTNSDCGVMLNSTETLVFDFFDDWKLTMEFKYNATSKMWYGSEVSLSFNYDNTYFPNATGPSGKQVAKLSNQTLFMVNNGSSFQCVSQSPLSDFSGLPKDFQMNITTTNLRVEAFRGINNTDFAMSTPCRADTAVSNIVPIAVGCALAGLVVIVLIAYLIGRKRSKRGYESV